MATSTGKADVLRYMDKLPNEIRRRVLRAAVRAGGTVIADEAKLRCASDDVAAKIVVKTKAQGGLVTVRITINGRWEQSRAYWLEYGTEPHFITIDESRREGRTVAKINEKIRDGSLKIGNNFVGASVEHPGAGRRPFLRPALDVKLNAALATTQGVINSRLTRAGIVGGENEDTGE